ncbi:glycosyl transferase family 1 [Reticulibacter mediterranei]|uniref:Glycosyl transferase family 1 n=1 Tax=Reticulibacter mediterranei TaxID=2778369 RepID=A0A8J3IIA8_9CHLR|nr:glycosyltransferase [Reticulibacter mediterranei]GHO91879.1 glycosyl transferase family 1 [Reticulibacter mediterranei]
MRILFVVPYVPSLIRVRPYQLIKALSLDHEISLVALLCNEYEQDMAKDVARYCTSIDLVPLSEWRAYLYCLGALPTMMPLRVAYYQSSYFVQRLVDVVHTHKIEIVHGELIKVVPALKVLQARVKLPVIYDSVDCISSYLQQQHRFASNLLQRLFIRAELRKMRGYEACALQAFDRVIITSKHDQALLSALIATQEGDGGSNHVQVVPNGVDTNYFQPVLEARETDSLVFCAKMDYYPNAQAMLLFCRDVLPLVWAQRPLVRLTIVGNNPSPAIRALAEDSRITVTGYVHDIRPYLSRAAVALAPLLVAAGMQNKVLEALAMATPVVATPTSCRALQVKDGVHLLIAEEAPLFARAILRLLEDRSLAERLQIAGRAYVEAHHCWQHSADLLCSIYHAMR